MISWARGSSPAGTLAPRAGAAHVLAGNAAATATPWAFAASAALRAFGHLVTSSGRSTRGAEILLLYTL